MPGSCLTYTGSCLTCTGKGSCFSCIGGVRAGFDVVFMVEHGSCE